MLLEKSGLKRTPRVFLPSHSNSIRGIEIFWPQFSQTSPVLNISSSGLVVPALGFLAKVKLGQVFDVVFKINGQNGDHQRLNLKLDKISADHLGLSFESLTLDGRLKVDQLIKDSIVSENMKLLSPKTLNPTSWSDVWFHGPFDSNILVWNKSNQIDLQKAVIEYDGLILIYEEGHIELFKSQSVVEATKGYAHPWLQKSSNKVSMGASYLGRLLSVLNSVKDPEFKLNSVISLIKNLRGH